MMIIIILLLLLLLLLSSIIIIIIIIIIITVFIKLTYHCTCFFSIYVIRINNALSSSEAFFRGWHLIE